MLFDFNGTISDDEPLLDQLFREVLSDVGILLTSHEYYRDLAGLSDPEIIERALTANGIDASRERVAQLLRAKIDRYKAMVSDRPTITTAVAEFVRATAARVPIAIVSGAVREEVEHVLGLAGLGRVFTAIVCIDEVNNGKPDPEGYLRALARINETIGAGRPPIAANEVLVFEDADAGVQAAKGAGMRCVALRSPAYTGAPVSADATIESLAPTSLDTLLRLAV